MTDTERAKAPTLEMVAAVAGVSRATVSRVVNGSPQVTPDVETAVRAAIAQLGYVPNRAARMLASQRTDMIAVVIPESTAKVFADPFFASIVQGVALRIAGTDYTLNLVIDSDAKPDKIWHYLLGGNVDGAIVISHHTGDHSYAQLGKLPIVFGGRPLGVHQGTYYVDADNLGGARMAVEHLVARGRRHLATIAGPSDMPPGIDRLEGWRQVVRERGLSDAFVEHGDFTPAGGADAMRRLLARGEPIDGVFAANDQMASGALEALSTAGLRVPEDVALVGFDDDVYSRTAHPAITTISQDTQGFGETMAEVLIRLIERETVDHRTVVPVSLVIRDST